MSHLVVEMDAAVVTELLKRTLDPAQRVEAEKELNKVGHLLTGV